MFFLVFTFHPKKRIVFGRLTKIKDITPKNRSKISRFLQFEARINQSTLDKSFVSFQSCQIRDFLDFFDLSLLSVGKL